MLSISSWRRWYTKIYIVYVNAIWWELIYILSDFRKFHYSGGCWYQGHPRPVSAPPLHLPSVAASLWVQRTVLLWALFTYLHVLAYCAPVILGEQMPWTLHETQCQKRGEGCAVHCATTYLDLDHMLYTVRGIWPRRGWPRSHQGRDHSGDVGRPHCHHLELLILLNLKNSGLPSFS